MSNSAAKLTVGPVSGSILSMMLPMALGIFVMIGNGLVDAYFIGQLGYAPLAAVSYAFPVWFVSSAIVMGLGPRLLYSTDSRDHPLPDPPPLEAGEGAGRSLAALVCVRLWAPCANGAVPVLRLGTTTCAIHAVTSSGRPTRRVGPDRSPPSLASSGGGLGGRLLSTSPGPRD